LKVHFDCEDDAGDKLEKIILGWFSRYKGASSKNKPLQLPDDDPEFARSARIAQILYEVFFNMKNAKGKIAIII